MHEILAAMKAATSPDEMRALLDRLGPDGSLPVLDLAIRSLDDPGLVEEAALAIIHIAPRLQATHPDAVKVAVQQVIGKSRNADTIREADQILRRISGMTRKAPAPASAPAIRALSKPSFSWKESDDTFALMNRESVVWQLNHAAREAKPYFHPVALIDGTPLTFPRPPDHPWHRGLWFSWKMLNGINYWEEDPKTGQAEGKTEITGIEIIPNADYSARIVLDLGYHLVGQPFVLTEKRIIFISTPTEEEGYIIDWNSEFRAGKEDVHLEGGTAGGYAGLSVRIAQPSREWKIANSEGIEDVTVITGDTATNTHGKRARWTDFSFVDEVTGQAAGIALIDHPENLRYPSEWHNVIAENIPFGYFSPAPLWSEPYDLPAGQVLRLRYRLYVHPGRPDAKAVWILSDFDTKTPTSGKPSVVVSDETTQR